MKILSIETSCDETAVSILEGIEKDGGTEFTILGNALLSQIDIHKEYGGVFPMLAKRAHAENLVPLLAASLEEAELLREDTQILSEEMRTELTELLEREPELLEALFAFLSECEVPDIDAIAVTYGPGLAPALWVGVNLARALSRAWEKPLVGVNHLEGHILSSLLVEVKERTFTLVPPALPLVSLVISGGHTELVVTDAWDAGTTQLRYKKIGETRDDAVGEAYDKVARMMGLPYPGGPEISKLADEAREANLVSDTKLPRPMIDSGDSDFSFSGLKTAVLYSLKDRTLSLDEKRALSRAFEDAVAEVLWKKTEAAITKVGAESLLIGGGVSANENLRQLFAKNSKERGVRYHLPHKSLTGDNAVMIGVAGYYRAREGTFVEASALQADGNLSLA